MLDDNSFFNKFEDTEKEEFFLDYTFFSYAKPNEFLIIPNSKVTCFFVLLRGQVGIFKQKENSSARQLFSK